MPNVVNVVHKVTWLELIVNVEMLICYLLYCIHSILNCFSIFFMLMNCGISEACGWLSCSVNKIKYLFNSKTNLAVNTSKKINLNAWSTFSVELKHTFNVIFQDVRSRMKYIFDKE